MIFKVRRCSDCSFETEDVEINSLDELKILQKKYAIPNDDSCFENPSLIIDFNEMTIDVYDHYIE